MEVGGKVLPISFLTKQMFLSANWETHRVGDQQPPPPPHFITRVLTSLLYLLGYNNNNNIPILEQVTQGISIADLECHLAS